MYNIYVTIFIKKIKFMKKNIMQHQLIAMKHLELDENFTRHYDQNQQKEILNKIINLIHNTKNEAIAQFFNEIAFNEIKLIDDTQDSKNKAASKSLNNKKSIVYDNDKDSYSSDDEILSQMIPLETSKERKFTLKLYIKEDVIFIEKQGKNSIDTITDAIYYSENLDKLVYFKNDHVIWTEKRINDLSNTIVTNYLGDLSEEDLDANELAYFENDNLSDGDKHKSNIYITSNIIMKYFFINYSLKSDEGEYISKNISIENQLSSKNKVYKQIKNIVATYKDKALEIEKIKQIADQFKLSYATTKKIIKPLIIKLKLPEITENTMTVLKSGISNGISKAQAGFSQLKENLAKIRNNKPYNSDSDDDDSEFEEIGDIDNTSNSSDNSDSDSQKKSIELKDLSMQNPTYKDLINLDYVSDVKIRENIFNLSIKSNFINESFECFAHQNAKDTAEESLNYIYYNFTPYIDAEQNTFYHVKILTNKKENFIKKDKANSKIAAEKKCNLLSIHGNKYKYEKQEFKLKYTDIINQSDDFFKESLSDYLESLSDHLKDSGSLDAYRNSDLSIIEYKFSISRNDLKHEAIFGKDFVKDQTWEELLESYNMQQELSEFVTKHENTTKEEKSTTESCVIELLCGSNNEAEVKHGSSDNISVSSSDYNGNLYQSFDSTDFNSN